MGFTATSLLLSSLQAGSNLSQTIGNTEIMRLGNMSLSKTYIFNSKLVDGPPVGLTIQKILPWFITQDHVLDVLDAVKVFD